MANLVPDPPRSGGDAKRYGWRTVCAVPWLARTRREIGEREMHVNDGSRRNRTFEIIRKAFYTNTRVNGLAILSGSGADSRAIVNAEWKRGDPEILVWRQSVRTKTVEELPDVPVRHDRGRIV